MTSALPSCGRATKRSWSRCERPLILLYCIVFTGQYDKCLAVLRESNKESMESVRVATDSIVLYCIYRSV